MLSAAGHKIESVAQSESSSQSELMFVGAIDHNNKTGADECHTTLEIEGHSVKFKVDTGFQVNILPQSVYEKLSIRSKLTKSTTRLSYSGEDLKVKVYTVKID